MANSYLNNNAVIDIRSDVPLVAGYAYMAYNFGWGVHGGYRPFATVRLHNGKLDVPVFVCVYVEPLNRLQGVAVSSGITPYTGDSTSTSKPRLYPDPNGTGRFVSRTYGFAPLGRYFLDMSLGVASASPSFENTYRGAFALSVLDDAEYDPETGNITKNPTARVEQGGAYVGGSTADPIIIPAKEFPIEECTVMAIFNTVSRTGNLSINSDPTYVRKEGVGSQIVDIGSFAYNATYNRWYAVQHSTAGYLNFWWRY